MQTLWLQKYDPGRHRTLKRRSRDKIKRETFCPGERQYGNVSFPSYSSGRGVLKRPSMMKSEHIQVGFCYLKNENLVNSHGSGVDEEI